MRIVLMLLFLGCASSVSAERVKVCGPRGCYFLERTATAAKAVRTVERKVTRSAEVLRNRGPLRLRVFPLRRGWKRTTEANEFARIQIWAGRL